MAIGTKWVLVATATDGDSDGWIAVRRADIKGIWRTYNERLMRWVFELEDHWPPAAPAAPLALDGTVQELIESAAAAFPLVTMFVEDEDTVHIGVPVRWTPKWVHWRHLDRNAEWVSGSHRHRQSDIIRVDFGGRHEPSLARVAGLTSQVS